MNKFIILTGEEISDWGIENVSQHLCKVGTDGTGLFEFETVPSELNSYTAYTKEEIDVILRDINSVFYTEGY
jgi:hypothetical protein